MSLRRDTNVLCDEWSEASVATLRASPRSLLPLRNLSLGCCGQAGRSCAQSTASTHLLLLVEGDSIADLTLSVVVSNAVGESLLSDCMQLCQYPLLQRTAQAGQTHLCDDRDRRGRCAEVDAHDSRHDGIWVDTDARGSNKVPGVELHNLLQVDREA